MYNPNLELSILIILVRLPRGINMLVGNQSRITNGRLEHAPKTGIDYKSLIRPLTLNDQNHIQE